MNRSHPHFGRREFLFALGAGIPLSAQDCDDAQSIGFRAGSIAEVEVKQALNSQSFVTHARSCSVPMSLPVAVGDQIRLTRSSSEYALYTVAQKLAPDEPNRVRMGQAARSRLGTIEEFPARLSLEILAQGLTDAEAQAASEFVERLVDDGKNVGLVVIAPHGGAIELNTDLQAEVVTDALGCSSWICKGWRVDGSAYERWHINSSKLSPNSFPGLGQIADRGFAHCVSFHGMGSGDVLIGGAAPVELRKWMQTAILAALSDPTITVDLVGPGEKYAGDSSENVNNWLTEGGFGGVQIEQGPDVRLEHWEEVAKAVIGVFAQLI
jgi:phage replication-related protein YjqB (UPF0714/DUF867 family)